MEIIALIDDLNGLNKNQAVETEIRIIWEKCKTKKLNNDYLILNS